MKKMLNDRMAMQNSDLRVTTLPYLTEIASGNSHRVTANPVHPIRPMHSSASMRN